MAIDPDLAFSWANFVAIFGWTGLVAALFWPRVRPAALTLARFTVPALLAGAYLLLLAQGWGQVAGGGFGSIDQVRALFADDSALAAGWLHYLAFDLFVGAWILRDAAARQVPALLVLPCLPLTFLFGPAGLLAYLALRLDWRSPRVAVA
jgi:hypothetical protein